MSSWERLWCIHGRREELDYHDCPKCRERTTKEYGEDEPTHIYLTEEPEAK